MRRSAGLGRPGMGGPRLTVRRPTGLGCTCRDVFVSPTDGIADRPLETRVVVTLSNTAHGLSWSRSDWRFPTEAHEFAKKENLRGCRPVDVRNNVGMVTRALHASDRAGSCDESPNNGVARWRHQWKCVTLSLSPVR
jgi:hypothetical protein